MSTTPWSALSAKAKTICASPLTVDIMSVTEEGVIILAESAELESEIDADSAKSDSESDDPATAAKGRARLRALGQID